MPTWLLVRVCQVHDVSRGDGINRQSVLNVDLENGLSLRWMVQWTWEETATCMHKNPLQHHISRDCSTN